MTENAGRKQGGQFRKGQSGNPAGKPKGLRNTTTRVLEALLDGEAEEIVRKAVELAKEGDAAAMRAVLDRLLPPRKDRHVEFALPKIETIADLPKASAALLDAVAAGELTPSEANELGKLIEAHVRAVEVSNLDERLAKLEGMFS